MRRPTLRAKRGQPRVGEKDGETRRRCEVFVIVVLSVIVVGVSACVAAKLFESPSARWWQKWV